MNPTETLPAASVFQPIHPINQNIINCDANIAFVEEIWNQRYNGKQNTHDVVHTNPLRAEYHKLFNCISRTQKIMKKLAKEKKFVKELILCKERSVPEMAALVENLSIRNSRTHPIPYMWNHEEQREVISNLNFKWDEMVLQEYLTSVLPDDEESDNDVSFDEKYGIVKTKLSEISMNSLATLFLEQLALKEKNERLKNEVLALEREERQLQRTVQEEVAEMLLPFSSKTAIKEDVDEKHLSTMTAIKEEPIDEKTEGLFSSLTALKEEGIDDKMERMLSMVERPSSSRFAMAS